MHFSYKIKCQKLQSCVLNLKFFSTKILAKKSARKMLVKFYSHSPTPPLLESISPIIFCAPFLYKSLFSSYILALNELMYEKHTSKTSMKVTPRVDFTNILQAAFTLADPKSAKKKYGWSVFFYIFWICAHKSYWYKVMKSTPRAVFLNLFDLTAH